MRKITLKMSSEHLKTISKHNNYTVLSAFMELFDNSVAAMATFINIFFDVNKKSLVFSDNGKGMTQEEFEEFMFTLSNSNSIDNKDASGQYGLGGKASLEYLSIQNSIVTFECHKEGNEAFSVKWGLGVEAEVTPLPNNTPIGTKITISETWLSPEHISELKNEIGMWAYPTLSKGNVVLRIQNHLIKPQDPLYRNIINESEYYKGSFNVFSNGIEYPVSVTAICLKDKVKKENLIAYDGNTSERNIKGKRNGVEATNRSGFYINYCGRYITNGGNFNLLGKIPHADFAGYRIEIGIEKKLSSLIEMTWNKSGGIKPFHQIMEFEEMVNTLKSYLNNNNRSETKIRCQKKVEKQIKMANSRLKHIGYNSNIDFNLSVDNLNPKMPLLTFDVDIIKGKGNKKKCNFVINGSSKRMNNNEIGIDTLTTLCHVAATVYLKTNYNEDITNDVIEECLKNF